jgi:hypothetical protein
MCGDSESNLLYSVDLKSWKNASSSIDRFCKLVTTSEFSKQIINRKANKKTIELIYYFSQLQYTQNIIFEYFEYLSLKILNQLFS